MEHAEVIPGGMRRCGVDELISSHAHFGCGEGLTASGLPEDAAPADLGGSQRVNPATMEIFFNRRSKVPMRNGPCGGKHGN